MVAMYTDSSSAGVGMEVVQWGGAVLGSKVSYNTDPNAPIAYYGEILTIDLGVPTGNLIGIYLKMWSGVNGTTARCRVPGIYKEG
jgi:hypothetical protein